MKHNVKNLGMLMMGLAVVLVTTVINPSLILAKEVRIAIIDSGATAHVDEAISFSSYPANTDPLHHGTVVSQLIRQGAPEAHLYMLQVCEHRDGKLKPSVDAVKDAIRWAIANSIDVVNMSLVIEYDQEIDRLITDASIQHGILFIAASGNNAMKSQFAMDANGFMTRNKSSGVITFPASNKYVISVGGLNKQGKVARYSDQVSDIYTDGKVMGQEGSSFSCARISAKVAEILKLSQANNKSSMLAYLK